ncbi:hypothetical protein [Ralstonia solanacearum]|uniref:hypothetical protein n=1 Tax=Ralstonia solanacearum TaxID=305 RepID=UPI0012D48852|nr:hypothetical protein [Ralstonia solanacearum]MCL9824597.1 hypothetical protein [Ralstonia solanacearum]MCL9830026.1 hypothetical protein [Ralstonia solanacearum]MCL9834807.1 hypothetical protein [Ralstonia solanacearum]
MTNSIDINKRLQEAVQSYWEAGAKNREKQVASGEIGAGRGFELYGVRSRSTGARGQVLGQSEKLSSERKSKKMVTKNAA